MPRQPKKTAVEFPRTFEELRYDFTEPEKDSMGRTLAQKTDALIELEGQVKAQAAANKMAVDASRRELALLAENINRGWEMRTVELIHELDTPRAGLKRLVRSDTGKTVREERMTDAELQVPLPLEQADESVN